jgi:uncharacterized membrane protein YedE/YeeE
MISNASPLGLLLAVVFGAAFGWLLHRGRVTNYDVIVNQFRFKDFTVLKVMLTAIIVGGLGVLLFVHLGLSKWHVRDANMLGVLLGGGLFGIGMVLYGYCPGTAIAAVATGSLHALVGIVGMLAGAMLYAYSFAWVRDNVLSTWSLGKITLSDVTGLPALLIYGLLAALALVFFRFLEARRIVR